MNKILISSVAAAVLATVSGSALAASAVDVTTADQTVGDEEAANLTAPESKYPYGISAFQGLAFLFPILLSTLQLLRKGKAARLMAFGIRPRKPEPLLRWGPIAPL